MKKNGKNKELMNSGFIDMAREFSYLRCAQREYMLLRHVDLNGHHVKSEILGIGSDSGGSLSIRNVAAALMRSGSDSFYILHNHPSSFKAMASEEDTHLTEEIGKMAKALEVKFQDHLIVSKNEIYSCSREKSFNFDSVGIDTCDTHPGTLTDLKVDWRNHANPIFPSEKPLNEKKVLKRYSYLRRQKDKVLIIQFMDGNDHDLGALTIPANALPFNEEGISELAKRILAFSPANLIFISNRDRHPTQELDREMNAVCAGLQAKICALGMALVGRYVYSEDFWYSAKDDKSRKYFDDAKKSKYKKNKKRKGGKVL